jgi:hypothetical protein
MFSWLGPMMAAFGYPGLVVGGATFLRKRLPGSAHDHSIEILSGVAEYLTNMSVLERDDLSNKFSLITSKKKKKKKKKLNITVF